MNDLQISKSDVKKALAVALVVPIGCFIAGFSTAKIFETDFSSQIANLKNNPVEVLVQTKNVSQTAEVTSNTQTVSTDKTKRQVVSIEPLRQDPVVEEPAILIQQESFSSITPKPFAIQAGVFQFYENASLLQSNLLELGIDSEIVLIEDRTSSLYRVVLDQFESNKKARVAIKELRAQYRVSLTLTRLADDFILNKIAAS